MAREAGQVYKERMNIQKFRAHLLAAMKEQGMSKAELARRSGVGYHAIDKFLKGTNVTTSAERAKSLADAVGISLSGDQEYEELRVLFFQLPQEQREFVLRQMRALASQEDE